MIQLEARHLKIVKDILSKYPYEFFTYGSRAKGNAQKFSDLDLCVKGDCSLTVIGEIKFEFEESDLPFTVDVISWEKISDSFKASIRPDLKKI